MPLQTTGFEWSVREDGILVYRFKDSRRQTIDQWVTIHRQHQNEHIEAGKPIRRIWFLEHGVIPTPYAFHVMVQLTREVPPGTHTHVAAILESSRVQSLIQYAYSRIDARKDFIRFFSDEGEALDWLKSTEDVATI
ncbi:MAG: hypothetical protein KC546_01870 [Anaerolineae bacterium]|nr:hypothetical protein [Anaerolineae bacterium]MCA9892438.1 hypothetical protein [Anaerolineae bacterium]